MNLIQLIGVGDNNYNTIKTDLSELLSNNPSLRNIVLEEVNDIDTIMEFNLGSIPALAVNGKIVFEQNGQILGKERLRQLMSPYLRQLNMKNILVPTDFSEVSEDAFHFAYALAAYNGGSLKVIHVSHPSFDTANPMGTYIPGSFEKLKREQLDHFMDRLSPLESATATENRIPISAEVVIGFTTEEIIRYSKDSGVDMVIMGTTGEGGFLNKLIGSVSSRVAQKAWCPVMLIPKGYRSKGFKNILYASDHKAVDEVMVREMVDFALFHGANIHLLHVKESSKDDFRVAKTIFEEIVSTSAPNLSYQYSIVESKSVFQGIQRYIEKNEIDLLSMVTAHRGFIEDLFHKSLTKQMAFGTDIPLLVMHFDE